jgi:hypothetical protein
VVEHKICFKDRFENWASVTEHTCVVPVTLEAEAGGSLEPRSLGSALATERYLVSKKIFLEKLPVKQILGVRERR